MYAITKKLCMSAFLLAIAAPVWADDDCLVPITQWQPRGAALAAAEEKGWTVRRIKIDDGCYEITGTNAQGQPAKMTFHPGTLAVLKTEDESSDEDADQD